MFEYSLVTCNFKVHSSHQVHPRRQGGMYRGHGDASGSLQHPIPSLEVNFVSKGGTLEIPSLVQLVKWISFVA